MRLRTSSILAMAFFTVGSVIAYSNREKLLNVSPGYPQEEQFQSVLVWAGLCLLVVSTVKLALAETRSRQGQRESE